MQPRLTKYDTMYTDYSMGHACIYVFIATWFSQNCMVKPKHNVKLRYSSSSRDTNSAMNRQIDQQTKCGIQCHRTIVYKFTVTPKTPRKDMRTSPERRFGHIRLDLVGSLLSVNGHVNVRRQIYTVTRIMALSNISAHVMVVTLTIQWLARFGMTDVIMTDQAVNSNRNC